MCQHRLSLICNKCTTGHHSWREHNCTRNKSRVSVAQLKKVPFKQTLKLRTLHVCHLTFPSLSLQPCLQTHGMWPVFAIASDELFTDWASNCCIRKHIIHKLLLQQVCLDFLLRHQSNFYPTGWTAKSAFRFFHSQIVVPLPKGKIAHDAVFTEGV